MSSIWIIAKNTYREIIRDRILYGIIVFALLLIGLSLVLGELSIEEQAKISADFGFTGIQLSSSILAIFIGSSLVAKEIDKQTILTLLARPISRAQFLLGKFAGLVLVIAAVIGGLSIVLGIVMMSLDFSVETSFYITLFGVLLEALILISVALFFGTFSRPTMTVIFTSAIFLIGHWIHTLDEINKKNQSSFSKTISGVVRNALPDLERFNWRSAPVNAYEIPVTEVLTASGYAVGWITFLMALTIIIFRRRDFV